MTIEEWDAEFAKKQRMARTERFNRQRVAVRAAVRNFLFTVLISAVTFVYLLIQDRPLNGMFVLLGLIALSAISVAWEAHTLRKMSA